LSIAQLHLYTEQWVRLWSDRPNSQWQFEFKTLNTLLRQWTTKLYAVIDTTIVWYNGGSQDDSVEFTLRISDGEAKGVFSSSTYEVGIWARSLPISIQSVLIDMIEFVDAWAWARVTTTLNNWTNTLAILKITTVESNNNEFNSPRDLDTILDTLTVQVSDSTVGESAKNSLVLRRIDDNWNNILWTTDGSDDIVFVFDNTDSSSRIDNWSTAYYRIEATNVQLNSNQWESVRIELNQAKEAITYSSSDTKSSIFTKNNNALFVISGDQITD
jgi:hypothetical protein